MEYTFKFSSNATNESARYVDILQNLISLIIEDSILNGYDMWSNRDELDNLALDFKEYCDLNSYNADFGSFWSFELTTDKFEMRIKKILIM